jgi:Gpi18-like mannosyltransferase
MRPRLNELRSDVTPTASSPVLGAGFPWRPRFKDVLGIVGIFFLNRMFLIVVGMVAWNHQIPKSSWRGIDHQTGIRYFLVPDKPLLDMWTRWDSWEYEEIARKGYWYDFNAKPNPYGTVACFPLYPMAVRVVGFALGGRYVVAGLLVANLASIAGFVVLFQWAAWRADRRAAWLTASLAISFPPGLFWSALYPQSLFFVLSIASLAMMYDGRMAGSCLLSALATATRLEAVALIPTLVLIRISQRGWRIGRQSLWFLATPLGLLGYMAYLYERWGDPFLFLKVHAIFGRTLKNPFMTLLIPIQTGEAIDDFVILGSYAVFVVLVLAWFSRVGWPIVIYGWSLFLIPLTSGVYMSIYRVHLVNVAIYLTIGLGLKGGWRRLGWAIVALCTVLQCRMMFEWSNGYFWP